MVNEEAGCVSVRKLFSQVYDVFRKEHAVREFEIAAETEVYADPDPGSGRIGEFQYRRASFVRLNGKTWVIAVSEEKIGTPAMEYDCDLIAFPIQRTDRPDHELIQEMECTITDHSRYFRHSLLVGLCDGKLMPGRGHRAEAIAAHLSPTITPAPRYHPAFFQTVSAAICDALSNPDPVVAA